MTFVDTIGLLLPQPCDAAAGRIAEVFVRQVAERCPAKVAIGRRGPTTVELCLEQGCPAEGFRIESGPGTAQTICITSSDRLGLLYGVGKFLHTSQYDTRGFTASSWRGSSAPECPLRGIYLATHFNNFYEAAPAEKVERYIEDLALWGLNAIMVHFPTHQFAGLDDPAAQVNLQQIRDLLNTAKRIGLRTTLGQCANQGAKDAPQELLAAAFPDDWKRRGTLGVNVCPSRPAGHDYLRKLYRRLFEELGDVGLDYLSLGPYDEGGCGCPTCWPWGARGYPKLSRELAAIAREQYPQLKLILFTWMFDTPPAGEWEGLAALLARDAGWVDYIMADAHEDFPPYPLTCGVPGSLPLVNFPEISMWGMSPWGGFGANPLPRRLQRLWNQVRHTISGGFPYSEGIYEDINKVICAQFQWQKDRPAQDILREYVSFEYSPEAADDLLAAIEILENNHPRRKVPEKLVDAGKAFDLVDRAGQRLSPQAGNAWRWRILYLRALIDREFEQNGGKLQGSALRGAFAELRGIYHVNDRTLGAVLPPEVKA